ncbi:MAG TPA: carbohydrate ABC transporter permease [Chloroflexota bacterium]|jgi:ABC-type glycerol-3-phosphate transport system permease component|nr:carbohydrate ABC transporter permease [Chloroflexota bacterium]
MATRAAPRAETAASAAQIVQPGIAVLTYLIAILFGLLAVIPFFWAVSYSFRDVAEVFQFPPPLLPPRLRWENYVTIFQTMPFALWIVNTVQITVLATLGTVVSATVVAYSFARFRYPGRDLFFFVTIATLILPGEVTIVPTYLIFRGLGWLDSFRPLIVPSWLGGGAFYIFLLRQFLLTIPRDFDDAAKIDGASSLQTLLSVIAPLLKPAIVAVTVISFIGQWDDFFNPLIYLNTPTKFTLSLGLNYLQSSLSGEGVPQIHLLMVAATLATLPPLLLFFVAQRYFIEGVVLSGLKA